MTNPSYALAKAIEAIEAMNPKDSVKDPKTDPRWIAVNEIYRSTCEAFDAAADLEYKAVLNRLAAQKAKMMARIRLELLEIDLDMGSDCRD